MMVDTAQGQSSPLRAAKNNQKLEQRKRENRILHQLRNQEREIRKKEEAGKIRQSNPSHSILDRKTPPNGAVQVLKNRTRPQIDANRNRRYPCSSWPDDSISAHELQSIREMFEIPESLMINRDSLANSYMLERLLSYLKIESQSIDDPSMTSFPMTEGQKLLAQFIYNELDSIVKRYDADDVKVTLSDDYYVYIDIPANTDKEIPSILFMAHMDVTPEAPGNGIKPIVHGNYDGGDIPLNGITLSPNTPQGAHLKDLVGKTIVTSDGTTLLGADDKTGCAILVTLAERLIFGSYFMKAVFDDQWGKYEPHGRVMIVLSQNEDVGKAAMRYDPGVFGCKPDIVIDVDGSRYGQFSIANFTAIGQTYHFKGNKVHPSNGKKDQYADALSAAAYFMGLVPPSMNPSAREGEEGYVHCYSLSHPLDDSGNPIASDYVVKVRLRYFDLQEGEMQKQMVADNLRKTQEAFPLVTCTLTDNEMQYQNIAYTMPDYVPELLQKAAQKAGMTMQPRSARGGTTTAMMVARFPDIIPGGPDLYSGQNAVHSCYEWCCIEEMLQIVDVAENIIMEISNK